VVSYTSTLDSSSTDFVAFCSNREPAGPAHHRPPFPDDDSGGSGPGSGGGSGGSGGSALKEAGSKGNVQRASGQYNQLSTSSVIVSSDSSSGTAGKA